MNNDDVGFFAGQKMVDRKGSMCGKFCRTSLHVRIAFLFFSNIFIISSSLLVIKGMQKFESAIYSTYSSNDDIYSLASKSLHLADSLIEVADDAFPIQKELVDTLTNMCPGHDLQQFTEIKFDDITKKAINDLEQMSIFVESTVNEYRHKFYSVIDMTERVKRILLKIEQHKKKNHQNLFLSQPSFPLSSLLELQWLGITYHRKNTKWC